MKGQVKDHSSRYYYELHEGDREMVQLCREKGETYSDVVKEKNPSWFLFLWYTRQSG